MTDTNISDVALETPSTANSQVPFVEHSSNNDNTDMTTTTAVAEDQMPTQQQQPEEKRASGYTDAMRASVPIQLEWKNLTYTATVRPGCFKKPFKKVILDKLSGYVCPYVFFIIIIK